MKITKIDKIDHEKIAYALAEAFNQWRTEIGLNKREIAKLSGFSEAGIGLFSNHQTSISSTFILWCIFNGFDPLNYQDVWDAFSGLSDEEVRSN